MRLIIEIPDPREAISHACSVPLATRGLKWSGSSLGPNAKESGVYIIHHAGVIKYVGKTDAPTMSYGMRLRREFQETASSGKHNYPKLALLSTPPPIMVSFFSSKTIESLVAAEGLPLTTWGKVELFETALTHVYNPEFQRHNALRWAKRLIKLGFSKEDLEVLRETRERREQ